MERSKVHSTTLTPEPRGSSLVLTWDHDWAHYPTSDVDLIVCSPSIAAHDSRMQIARNQELARL